MNLARPCRCPRNSWRCRTRCSPPRRRRRAWWTGRPCPPPPPTPVWCSGRGDITRLRADAIVNAANSALLGCFVPCHGCIDNAIHSAAGLQLREACFRLMEVQDHPEPSGRAKLTKGYNLPGPVCAPHGGPHHPGTGRPGRTGRSWPPATRACLTLAAEKRLRSVALCCISTGEFHFPQPGGRRPRRENGQGVPSAAHFYPEGDLQCI